MDSQILYKSIFYSLLVLILFTGNAGCDNFLDVNDDPNAATEIPGDPLFLNATVELQSNRNIEFGPALSFFPQVWASNGIAGVFLEPDRYIIGSADFTVTNSWETFYTDVLNNFELLIRDAQDRELVRNNAIAQARLLQVYTFYVLTAMWGEVPFGEALNEDMSNPAFDSQEEILRGLLTEIENALAMVDFDSNNPHIEERDVFYGGNLQQWVQFGNSLKLRVLMLLYNKDASVASQIQALIDHPDLIRTNSDSFEFPYNSSNGNENQVYQLHADFSSGQPAFIYGSKTLIDLMKIDDDPRLSTYFLPNSEGEFVGAENGAIGQDASLLGSNIIRPDFPGRILTASETLFHEAEFLAAEGQTTQARIKLQTGIEASIDYFDGAPGAISDTDRDAYVNTILAHFDAGTTDDQVRIVQEQHFIDVFEKSPENWTLWRRTKTPELTLPQNAQLGSVIRRLPYPSSETSSNPNTPNPMPTRDEPMWFEKE